MSTDAAPLHPAEIVRELFATHGIAAQTTGDLVWVDAGHLRIRATVGGHHRPAVLGQRQLDVTVIHAGLETGTITESFVGLGVDDRAAMKDALHQFSDAMFHGLLCMLLDRPTPQVTVENWTFQGQERRVVLGSLCTRGEFPAMAWPAQLHLLKDQLAHWALPTGSRHTLSYFASRGPGAAPMVHVLLNGLPAPGMNLRALAQGWPEAPGYYSARFFALVDETPAGA
jgi:hypothetical protein